jgi:hypothetical protein
MTLEEAGDRAFGIGEQIFCGVAIAVITALILGALSQGGSDCNDISLDSH